MQHRISFARVCGGVALTGGLVAAAVGWSDAEAPSDELRRRMSGSFVVAEPEADIEMRLGEAVERVVARLGPNVRPVARAQLSRVVDYCREYKLEIGVDSVGVHCDPVDGEALGLAPRLRLDASDAGLRAAFDEDVLVLSTKTDGGAEITTYRIDDASGELRVEVRMTSEQLDRPLAWSVRYRRTAEPSAAVAASLTER